MSKLGLFSGQSNAVGNGPGGPWRISSLVKVRNNATNRSDLLSLGSSWLDPTREMPCFWQENNNQGLWAAHYLARATGESQRLVISARNGRSINDWHDGTSTGLQYNRILAICEQAGISKFDWFGWNQGSADNWSASTYRSRWDAMIARMEADGLIDGSTPIFISETARTHAPAINIVLRDIADADPRIGFARLGSYPTIDGAHFTGDALARAGHESVRALAETVGTIYSNVINPLAVTRVTGSGYSRAA